MNLAVVKLSFCLFLAFEIVFGCLFMHAPTARPIFIATVIDIILEPQFKLFKFLIIGQIIVIQNPELWYYSIIYHSYYIILVSWISLKSNLYNIGSMNQNWVNENRKLTWLENGRATIGDRIGFRITSAVWVLRKSLYPKY